MEAHIISLRASREAPLKLGIGYFLLKLKAVRDRILLLNPKTILIILGALGAAVCFGFNLYVLDQMSWAWGSKPEKMNEVGDFLGGVTGPLLNFLTFIAVLYAAALQVDELKNSNKALDLSNIEMEETKKIAEEQVKHLKKEAKKNEIEKTLSVVDRELDDLFDERIGPHGVRFEKIYIVVSKERDEHRKGNLPTGDFQEERFEKLNENLIMMNGLLEDYSSIESSSPLITYYIVKYASKCSILVNSGEFSKEDVQSFFSLFPGKFMPRKWLKKYSE